MSRVLLFTCALFSTVAFSEGLVSISKTAKPCRVFSGRDVIMNDGKEALRAQTAYLVEDYSGGKQFGLNMDVVEHSHDQMRVYRMLIIGDKVSEDANTKAYVATIQGLKATYRVQFSEGNELVVELETDRYGIRTISNFVCAKDQL